MLSHETVSTTFPRHILGHSVSVCLRGNFVKNHDKLWDKEKRRRCTTSTKRQHHTPYDRHQAYERGRRLTDMYGLNKRLFAKICNNLSMLSHETLTIGSPRQVGLVCKGVCRQRRKQRRTDEKCNSLVDSQGQNRVEVFIEIKFGYHEVITGSVALRDFNVFRMIVEYYVKVHCYTDMSDTFLQTGLWIWFLELRFVQTESFQCFPIPCCSHP